MRNNIRKRFTVIIICSVLVPLIVFGVWLMHSFKSNQIQNQINILKQQANEMSAVVNQTVELCTLSSNVFLNNTNLIEHLYDLENEKEFSVKELYDFAINDISAMEKLIASNPYLYRIRVYSNKSDIDEIMPVLFSKERLNELNLSYSDNNTWCFDYTDNIFSANTRHLMSLLSPIKTEKDKTLGTLEVAVQMDKVFKSLFEKNQKACLVNDNGEVYGKNLDIDNKYELSNNKPVIWKNNNMLITAIRFDSLNSTYYSVYDLSSLYNTTNLWQLIFIIIVIIIALIISLLANRLVKNMLKQLYLVVDGVQKFSEGDMNVQIPVETNDEIGVFSKQINLLLLSIRDFINKQVKNEVIVKDTELKALQNQINAHFMYNVLECINMMAQIDEKYEISKAITDFGKLLRYTIGWKKPVVPLKNEIDYIKNYIALINLRYDGEITLLTDIPEKINEQLIPKVSIQPIVENIIVHSSNGIEDRKIFIRAKNINDDVFIEITSDAQTPSDEDKKRMEQSILGTLDSKNTSGNGIGLHNINERIKRTFGEKYGINVIDDRIVMILPNQI